MAGKVRRQQIGIHVDMTPMVDVMMLLVIFFMMTTAFVTVYPGFAVNLPQASAEKQAEKQLVVQIAQDGRIALSGQPIAKEELAAALSGTGKTTVSVQADKEVSHGRVVEVMDEIHKAGVSKLAIAIEEKAR